MTEGVDVVSSTLLVECLDAEPTLMTYDKGVAANLKPLPKVFRGSALGLIRSLIDVARSRRRDVVRAIDEPLASRLGPIVAAVPVVGPTGAVHGVRLRFGDAAHGGEPDPATGAYEWDIGVESLPPRLYLAEETLQLLAVPEDQKGRAVYGPLDFFTRLAQLADVVSIWEGVNNAAPGYVMSGSFALRVPAEDGTEFLRVLRFAERYLLTSSGPRVRGLLEDISNTVECGELRMSLLDAITGGHLLGEVGVHGLVFDTRLGTAPTVLRWLTPFVRGAGDADWTQQMPFIHPNDLARVPELLQRSVRGPVRDTMRVRSAGGGWIELRFTAMRIDEHSAPHVGLAIIHP